MAVYDLSMVSTTDFIDSLETALTTAGVLTSTLRKTTTNLLFTTSRFDYPIRVNAPATTFRMKYYWGTGWTSDDNLDEQATVFNWSPGTGAVTAIALIVYPTGLAFTQIEGTNRDLIIFGKADNVSSSDLAIGACYGTNANRTMTARNCDDGQNISFLTLKANTEVVSSGGKYYSTSLQVIEGGIILASGIKNVTQLLKARAGNHYVVYGDDVVVLASYAGAIGVDAIGTSLLIKDGAK